MNMIDRFMSLESEVKKYYSAEYRNPITYWKILHRKYEILKELKKKKSFNSDDLLMTSWIIKYGLTKWPDDEKILLDGAKVFNHEIGCSYVFEIKNLFYSITTSRSKNSSIDIYTKFSHNISKWTQRDIIEKEEEDDTMLIIFEIIKNMINYSIEYILNKLIKGE